MSRLGRRTVGKTGPFVNTSPPHLSAEQAVALLRSTLTEVQAKGQMTVPVAPLQQFLSNVTPSPAQSEVKRPNVPLELLRDSLNAQWQANLAHDKAVHTSNLEMFKSVLEATKGAIQSLFVINGGAAVALLAFIGHLASLSGGGASIPAFADVMLSFVGGAGFAVLLAVSVCLGQKAFYQKWTRTGNAMFYVSLFLGLASFVCFGLGCSCGYKAFVELKPVPAHSAP
jgi:hypothetical protein